MLVAHDPSSSSMNRGSAIEYAVRLRASSRLTRRKDGWSHAGGCEQFDRTTPGGHGLRHSEGVGRKYQLRVMST